MCFQLQVQPGGVLEVDTTDSPYCSSGYFSPTGTISTFKNVTADRVYYDEADLGWSGYFDFKESSSLTDIEVGVPMLDLDTLEYGVEVFLPACYDLPS